MTESDIPRIEIRDPGVPPGEDEPGGYQRNLLVPLVVVPAMIVMLGVLLATMFGLVSRNENTPLDNLEQLIKGGVNERQQAAFGLVSQLLDYRHARAEGRDPTWEIDDTFLEQLRSARRRFEEPTTPGEAWAPFVLSALMAQLGDEEGVEQLLVFTRSEDSFDPELRFRAVFILGAIGSELTPGQRARVADRMIELTGAEDEGLVSIAAAALQKLPGPKTQAALEGLLTRQRLDVRLQAALSLAELGSDAGVETLHALVEEAPYVSEREANPGRWAPQTVSESRCKILSALRALGRPPGEDVLRRLADEDSDPNVRAAALALLKRGAE